MHVYAVPEITAALQVVAPQNSDSTQLIWNESYSAIYPSGRFAGLGNQLAVSDDYAIVPVLFLLNDPEGKGINKFEKEQLKPFCESLPLWGQKKHLLFFGSTCSAEVDIDAIVFRTSCHKLSKDRAFYYEVDFRDTEKVPPISQAKHRCAFLGCVNTHYSRRTIRDAVGPGDFYEETKDFFMFLSDGEKHFMRRRWIDVLNKSQFILCPRGSGLNSFRFFEALAFGRIPVLFSDDAKLPMEDRIKYNEFVVRVPEQDIKNTQDYVNQFIRSRDVSGASEMAYSVWRKYFREFPSFLSENFNAGVTFL